MGSWHDPLLRLWKEQRSLVIVLVVLILRTAHFCIAFAAGDLESGGGYVHAGFRGDAGWYARIAQDGYPDVNGSEDLGHVRGPDVEQSEWAFFPLYPLMVRGVIRTLACDVEWAMFLLSVVLGMASIHLFSRFAESELGPTAAAFCTLGLLVFPTGLYFHVYYTEALFLSLLTLCFLAIRKDRHWVVPLASSLLVLVRPNGLMMLLPLSLYACEQVSGSISALWWSRSNIRKQLFLFGPAVLMFAAYCAYQFEHTGEAFAFSLAQAGWGRSFMMPYHAFFRSGDLGTQLESWFTLALVSAVLLLWRRFSLSGGVLVLLSVFVPLFSGAVDSMTRFVVVMLPLFLVYGTWLSRSRARWWVLGLSLVLQFGWWLWWLAGEPVTA